MNTTQTYFIGYSIVLSVFAVLNAMNLKFGVLAFLACVVQITFSYFFYVTSNFPYFSPLFYFYFQTIWFIYLFMSLRFPKLRSNLYRFFISWTSSWWTSTTWLAFIFLPLNLIYKTDLYIIISGIISLIGVFQTLHNFSFGENIIIDLRNRKNYAEVTRLERQNVIEDPESRHLRIFQITDTHLSSFTSVERLKELCEKVVELDPDLVCLTGDFCTYESRGNETAVAEAFEPLKKMKGKVVCCLGNHDYEEQLESIIFGLKYNEIIVLRDAEVVIQTRLGPVQVIGSEFYFRKSSQKISELYINYPRKNDCVLHLSLIHNPNMLKVIKDGCTDLILSGHFHGGQMGFLSLGINISFLRLVNIFSGRHVFLENGLWGFNTNRGYSHRGTGYYGFPIRLGIPSEESILNVYF